MSSRLRWLFRRVARRLWFRAAAFSAIAVVAALLALVLKQFIPYNANRAIGADAVGPLLNVLAASMLSVTIFSVSTLVAALSAAASSATPRAALLVAEDDTAQNALAIFLGSFLFSLVGIIALQTGLYGPQGRVILFVVTLAVITVVVGTMLRWIDHISKLGRVGETLERLERNARKSLRERRRNPHLGGTPWPGHAERPPAASPVHAGRIGYVQHVDMSALQKIVASVDGTAYLEIVPGAFVDRLHPLLWLQGAFDEEAMARAARTVTIGDTRSFDQDPRFALSVLTEVASRALSPAVNDPGTAIDVLGRATRLLAMWGEVDEDDDADVSHADVHVHGLLLDDLFDDAFAPIARDGAATVEVALRLQKMLRSLSQLPDPRYAPAARRQARVALARARIGLPLEEDFQRVSQVARELLDPAASAQPPA